MDQSTIFTYAEKVEASTVPKKQANYLLLPVPRGLEERRIYLFLDINLSSAADYFLETEIALLADGVVTGTLPACIASVGSLTLNQSKASLINGGGTAVGDSLALNLISPFTASITQVILQPLRINADIEYIQLNVLNVIATTATGMRAYLACQSTKY